MSETIRRWRGDRAQFVAALIALSLTAPTGASGSEGASPATEQYRAIPASQSFGASAAQAPSGSAPIPATLVGGFSAHKPGDQPPPPWRVQTFRKIPRHTAYSMVADGGITVLRALADNAAASLIRPVPSNLTVAANRSPVLRWRWKPLSAPNRSALGRKDADDWGARLYVMFEPPPASLGFGERLGLAMARALYGDDLPARGLCYVWAPAGQSGAMAPNAYTDRLAMIVVDTGSPGNWRAVERDLAADYQAAFGQPMAPLTAIAVSADSDNSGGIAEALIGDIVLEFTPTGTETQPGS